MSTLQEFTHDRFIRILDGMISDVHEIAKDKGFWDKPRNDAEMMMLIVTEIAEAVEGQRHGNGPSEHIPHFSCVEEELADAVIRIMDYCGGRGVRLAEAIVAKMKFNATRARMHGKKF